MHLFGERRPHIYLYYRTPLGSCILGWVTVVPSFIAGTRQVSRPLFVPAMPVDQAVEATGVGGCFFFLEGKGGGEGGTSESSHGWKVLCCDTGDRR